MSTIITSAILLAAIFIPFALMRRGIKKHEKEMVAELSELAEKNKAKISNFEVLKDIAIGIDEVQHKLFFIHKNEHLETKEMVDLRILKHCQLEKETVLIKDAAGDRSILEKVNLFFKSSDHKIPSIRLELFNANFDSPTLSGELQLAEKWEILANNCVPS